SSQASMRAPGAHSLIRSPLHRQPPSPGDPPAASEYLAAQFRGRQQSICAELATSLISCRPERQVARHCPFLPCAPKRRTSGDFCRFRRSAMQASFIVVPARIYVVRETYTRLARETRSLSAWLPGECVPTNGLVCGLHCTKRHENTARSTLGCRTN